MDSFLNDINTNKRRKWHEEEIITSQPYSQSKSYMHNLINDFKKGLISIGLVFNA